MHRPRTNPVKLLLPLALALLAGCMDRDLPTAPPISGGPSFLQVPGVNRFTQVSGGGFHACALRSDGVAECWGRNEEGQAPATRSALSGTFTQVSAGGYHTCALRSDGVAECWGRNGSGQAPAARSAPVGLTFTQVSAGWEHICALRSDGVAECWGYNVYDQAPATRTALSGTFTQVSAGVHHTCAVRSDGVAECWGWNDYNQAPATRSALIGMFTDVSAGGPHTCAVRSDGVAECWGLYAPAVRSALSGTFTQVGAGGYHTCALRSDGVAECWGNNGYGQAPAARSALSGMFTEVSAGHYFTCALRSDGVVECWGRDEYRQAPATRSASASTTTVLPTASFSAPASVQAGQSFVLELSNAQVPGHPDATQFTYAFDCGDGDGFTAASSTASRSCPTSSAGSLSVRGRVIDADLDFTDYTATVQVTAPVTAHVTLQIPAESPYDGSARVVTATTDPAGLTVAITYNGSATAPSNAGTYAVAGTVTSTGYAGSAHGTLTIQPAAQAISFTSTPPDPATVGGSYAVSATGGASGNPVVFSSLTPDVCSVTGSTVSLDAAGPCTVAADQTGSTNYAAAPQATQAFTVEADAQLDIRRPGIGIEEVQITGASKADGTVHGRFLIRNASSGADTRVTLGEVVLSFRSAGRGTRTNHVAACTVGPPDATGYELHPGEAREFTYACTDFSPAIPASAAELTAIVTVQEISNQLGETRAGPRPTSSNPFRF